MRNAIAALLALFVCPWAYSQQEAVARPDVPSHDFGVIYESDGAVTHTFTVSNAGDSPLLIRRVTVSCGCMQPEWTKTPIAPGATGQVKIRFNPKGRSGPFYKSVAIHSNASNGLLTLYMKGNVMERTPTEAPSATHLPLNADNGGLQLQTTNVDYTICMGETQQAVIEVKNNSDRPLNIVADNAPDFLSVVVHPQPLPPGATGEITLFCFSDKVGKKGRITTLVPLIAGSDNGEVTKGELFVAANIIDNFKWASDAYKSQAALANLSAAALDFGRVADKAASLPFTILNAGKSVLSVYSVTCDNPSIDITGGKRDLSPGASATWKVSLRPKAATPLDALIYIVSNDPSHPVRTLKVTAGK